MVLSILGNVFSPVPRNKLLGMGGGRVEIKAMITPSQICTPTSHAPRTRDTAAPPSRHNRLLAYFYRQANAGNAFSDASLAISPDAGQTWIDYGRYNAYPVTAASCAGTTATLTATNALSGGQLIYVHDIGPVYDGKHAIVTASGSQVTYAVTTCTGATGSSGYFGILKTDGSAYRILYSGIVS